MIRTTFLSHTTGAQTRLMERAAAADRAAARLSSGKAFSRTSEDPGAAATAMAFRSELSALKAYQSTGEDAQTRLNSTDAQLEQVQTAVARLKDLTVAAATGTMNDEGRAAIAAEITQLRDQLVGLANGRHLDQPLFAGYSANDAVTFSAGVWQVNANTNEKLVRSVSDTDSVQVNVVASEVFKAGATDAFTMLDQLVTDLNSGNTAGIHAAIDSVDALRTSASNARARIGAATNRIENVLEANISRQTGVRANLSKAEDIDLVEGVTEVNRQQAAYQAALGATAKSLQQSLVDFLR